MSAPSPKFLKLLAKLRELFELDKADLDFGLYRVLRARREEIDKFLREELLPQVQGELGVVNAEKIKPMESKVEEEIAKVMEYGGKSREEAEASDKVIAAKSLLEQARNPAALEDEVYSLLTTFFGRYYEAGDFISQRRYSGPGKEKYMLPYNGEEVKLVWANMDQHYIKSAENFRDYTFRVPALEPDEPVPVPDLRPRVSFKLIEADTEKDNVKAAATGKRSFALADPTHHPLELAAEDGLSVLRIPFTYAVRDKEDKQDTLLAAVEAAVLDAAAVPADLKKHLSAKAPTGTRADRTVLAKHLEAYADRNSFDYFIHKDLGGFLSRELDYFLKSELLRVDDLLTDDDHQRSLTLKKARAFRKVADKIITFLHRQEQFQKKLWLKKKFVVATDYAITLDHIPEEFYPEIATNDAQREQWVKLHAIDEIEGDLGQPGYSVPLTVEFLKWQQSLMLDTRCFTLAFKSKLIDQIPALHANSNTIVNSENHAALAILAEGLRATVKSIYLDPPYNTGKDGFMYKDSFQHSSWVSHVRDRVLAAARFLKDTGVMFWSIDENERSRLMLLLEEMLGKDNHLGTIVWKGATDNNPTRIAIEHEFITCWAISSGQVAPEWKNPNDEKKHLMLSKYKELADENADIATLQSRFRQWIKENSDSLQPLTHYDRIDEDGPYTGGRKVHNPGKEGYRYDVFHPVTKKPCKEPARGYRFPPSRMKELLEKEKVLFGDDHNQIIQIKEYLSDYSGALKGIVELDSRTAANSLERLFASREIFKNPKPPLLLDHILPFVLDTADSVLDFFAGSGTTAEAVIGLNREDGGRRKYILIEMGDHFDTVLVPRIKKLVYSPNWKDGKPTTRDKGISHCVKILRLESYEDCLNNLELTRSSDQDDLLSRNKDLREDYMLGYFLDVETRGSILKLDHFRAPWNYRMKIATGSVGETRETPIDLVETFNWLLGLTVQHQSNLQHRRPDKGFAEDEHGRLQLTGGLTRAADPSKDKDSRTFQTIEGTLRGGEKVLVIWRSLTPTKKAGDAARLLEEDNVMLESFLSRTALNPREKQWDLIYVNGDHTLDNLAERLAEDPTNTAPRFKVRTIEPEFHRLMFEGTED